MKELQILRQCLLSLFFVALISSSFSVECCCACCETLLLKNTILSVYTKLHVFGEFLLSILICSISSAPRKGTVLKRAPLSLKLLSTDNLLARLTERSTFSSSGARSTVCVCVVIVYPITTTIVQQGIISILSCVFISLIKSATS